MANDCNPKPVRLEDILEALEWHSENLHAYLELATGKVIMVTEDEFMAADDDDDESIPAWQRDSEGLILARRMAEDDDELPDEYVTLPDRYDIDEYRMIEDFAFSQKDDSTREDFCRAIQGRGAFRYFKDTIHRLGIEDEWYKARKEGYRHCAIDWCEEHGIPYLEGVTSGGKE